MIILIFSKYMHNQHFKTKMSGFLLIELMISLLLLMITIVLMGTFHNLVISNQYNTIKRWLASNQLHSFMAQATVDPELFKKNKICSNNITITWTLDEYAFESETKHLFAHQLVKNMHYTLQWKGWHNQNYTFQGSTGV